MTPEERVIINRRNASRSTGPKSTEGKRIVAQNAFRHGLTAQVCVMPGESVKPFNDFIARYKLHYQPAGVVEEQFVATIADSQWRLNHLRTVELGIYARGHSEEEQNWPAGPDERIQIALGSAEIFRENASTFHALSLHEQRIFRTMMTSIAKLEEMQAQRKKQEEEELPAATELLNLSKSKGLPYSPKADGFVFSCVRLERRLDFDNRRVEAKTLAAAANGAPHPAEISPQAA